GFSPEVINVLRRQTLDMLIQEELLWQMSKKYGITVTDAQVATRIQSDPGFANEFGQFDPRIYFHFLNYIRMTPKDFESVQRRQLAGEKLTILLASAVKVSDSELAQISRLTGDAETDFAITLQSKANYFLNVWFRRVLENANIRILLTF
ncbi:MAG: SurA N-terminal domain-containing protein, partial [Elusimicrobia bacterium]|nr:SurA N-terminal domain-containing protein [Elusimicrobiota bacterium]